MAETPAAPNAPVHHLVQGRIEKLNRLRQQGIDPYPRRFDNITSSRDIKEKFQSIAQEQESSETVRAAGRLMSVRDMGKASFAHIQDSQGQLQLRLQLDVLGEPYQIFKKDLDIGDWIGVSGTVFRTKTNELTLRVKELTLLSKSLRPLPEKWHGLKDEELRARQRYLDTTMNLAAREAFVKRSAVVSALRRVLDGRGFLEVETPMLGIMAGGAAAKPFLTHHNALDLKLQMRIAHELPLKRLLVGGFDRVYEIGRAFRNEGIDRFHNPEFTLLEAYQAYTDYEGMMELCEEMISAAAQAVGNQDLFKRPFRRASLEDLWKEHTGLNLADYPEAKGLRAAAEKLHVPLEKGTPEKKVFDKIFDAKICPALTEPTFVTDYPLYLSPLAKKKLGRPDLVERFELFVQGQEVANAYSELNDPIDQRERFGQQMIDKASGDEEAQELDEDFVRALEHGMPPAGGIGIGVDRLAMMLSGVTTVRDVILFPLLRPES